MKDFSLVLPTIALDKEYMIKDKAHDLHVQFHGKGHTAGDVVVYSPQKKMIAGGDLINGTMPYLPDAYPKAWVKTLDSIDKLRYDQVLPSHGPVMLRSRVRNFRNLIEEVVTLVDQGKKAGKSREEMKKIITADSLKSIKDDDYGNHVMNVLYSTRAHWETRFMGPMPFLQDQVDSVTSGIYSRLEVD
jgi:glyoxylase-like metal-dependent hydrolase (beta-lactamase superfamily II)